MNLITKKFNKWSTTEILKERSEIFILEYMDNIDYNSLHCFFWEGNKLIAYLRAFYQDDNKGIIHVVMKLEI